MKSIQNDSQSKNDVKNYPISNNQTWYIEVTENTAIPK